LVDLYSERLDADYQIALSYRGNLHWLCRREKRGRSPV